MKITLHKSRLETSILFFLLYVGILIDNIVGYHMRITGTESIISKLYRLFIVLYLLIIMLCNNRRNNGIYICLLVYGLLLPFIQGISNTTFEGISIDILNIIKLFFPFLLIVSGIALYKKNKIEMKDIDNYLIVISWIYPVSILVPYIIGVGFKAYSGTTGYSGFYSSANELSIILCITFIMHMQRFYEKGNIKSIIGVLIAAISIILTGTKTGIIIIVFTIVYYFIKRDRNALKKIRYFIFGLVAISIVIFIISVFLENELLANIERLQYKFQQLDRNVINFLFSNRNIKILPNFMLMLDNPIQIFFGAGYYQKVVQMKVHENIASTGLIEMDFFDVMFQYGLPIVLIIWGFYLKIFISSKNSIRKHYVFGLFCMLLYSFMAGHVMYSPSVGTVMALLCLGIVFSNYEKI